MDPILTLAIARSRQHDMEATAATERLAAQLRAGRPGRATIAGVALAGLVSRVRDTATAAAPAPCTAC